MNEESNMKRTTDNKAKRRATSTPLGNTDLTFSTFPSRFSSIRRNYAAQAPYQHRATCAMDATYAATPRRRVYNLGPPTRSEDIYRLRPEDVGPATRNKDIYRSSPEGVGYPTTNKDIFRSRPEGVEPPSRNKDIYSSRPEDVESSTRNKDISISRAEDVGSPTRNKGIFRSRPEGVGPPTRSKDICHSRPKGVGPPTRNKDIYSLRPEDVGSPTRNKNIFGSRAEYVGSHTRDKDIFRSRPEGIRPPTINKDIYKSRPEDVRPASRNKDIFRTRADNVVHPLQSAAIESSKDEFSDELIPSDASSDSHHVRDETLGNLASTLGRKSSGILEPNVNRRPDSPYVVFKKPVAPPPLAGVPKKAKAVQSSQVSEVNSNQKQKKLPKRKKIHSLERLSEESDCVYPTTSTPFESPVQQQNLDLRDNQHFDGSPNEDLEQTTSDYNIRPCTKTYGPQSKSPTASNNCARGKRSCRPPHQRPSVDCNWDTPGVSPIHVQMVAGMDMDLDLFDSPPQAQSSSLGHCRKMHAGKDRKEVQWFKKKKTVGKKIVISKKIPKTRTARKQPDAKELALYQRLEKIKEYFTQVDEYKLCIEACSAEDLFKGSLVEFYFTQFYP